MDVNTAYKILELPEQADLEQVKAARRELIFIWHPDKHQANANAQKRALQKTKEINEAYDFLCEYLNNNRNEYTFIECRNCGVKNRILGKFRDGLKCGKCGLTIQNPDNYEDQNKSKKNDIPCGDATCNGFLLENGRCGICGKTWEERKVFQRSREHKKESSANDGLKREPDFFYNLSEKPRPWVRFWAKHFDILIFSFIAGIIIAIFNPEILSQPDAVLGIMILPCSLLLDAFCLSFWGTTPGKFLLNIKVSKNLKKLTLSDANKRAFYTWFGGFGLGIPLINLITLYMSYSHLKTSGNCYWDEKLNIDVEHEDLSSGKTTAFVIVLILMILFITRNKHL